MANRFWVGGSGNWNNSSTANWASTSGGASGASAPTTSDDVFIDGNSGAGTVTINDATAVCRSLDCTGFTGTLAWAASSLLAVGDASGGAFKLASGMSTSWASAANLRFRATTTNGGTGWAVTTFGKNIAPPAFEGVGGKWVLQDSLVTSGGTLTLTSGTLDTNNQSLTCGSFSSSNSNTRTLTMGNSSITLSGTGTAWNATTSTNMTITANTATITLSGAGSNFAVGSGAPNYNGASVVFTGSGSCGFINLTTTATFANVTRTGTAAKTDSFNLVPNITCTGSLTLGGNTTQGVNRLLVQAGTLGTQRTVSAAAVVINGDVDFQDITITGSPTWTNSGSAFIGDCGGNGGAVTTNITTPATQTWNGDVTDSWSTVARWTSRVPLPQDNVVINQAFTGSKTISVDMPRFGKDIDFTGATGNPKFQTGAAFSAGATFFGSMTLISGMTTAQGGSGWIASGRGSHTITSAGLTWLNSWQFTGSVGGIYSLQDSFTTNFALTINDGTWTTNNNSVTCQTFNAASGRATVLNFGTSLVTVTSTANVQIISFNNSTTTVNGLSATFVISTASTNTRIVGPSPTGTGIGTLTYTVTNSPGILQIQNSAGNRTIGTMNIGSGRGLTFFATSTTTYSTFNVNGVANGYVYLPGVSGNNITAADNAAWPRGDFELLWVGSIESNWSTANQIIAAYGSVGSNRTWSVQTLSQGRVYLAASVDGSTLGFANSNDLGVSNGQKFWLRIRRFSAVAGVAGVEFAVSTDGVNFNTVSTTGNSISTGTLFDSTAGIGIGQYADNNGAAVNAKVYRFAMWSDTTETTKVFDADFTTHNVGSSNWLDAAKTQFTESSSNAATVTVNGSLAQAGDGRVILNSSTPGSRGSLSKTSGIVSCSYLSIKDSAADGGASWHAVNSADAGNNTGWIFASPSSTSGNFLIFGGMG